MRFGMKCNPGDVVLIATEYSKHKMIRKRPAFILYANDDTLIACGVSRSKDHKGIVINLKDGATKKCKIFLHHMFTISPNLVIKKLFVVRGSKKNEIYKKLKQKIQVLK